MTAAESEQPVVGYEYGVVITVIYADADGKTLRASSPFKDVRVVARPKS